MSQVSNDEGEPENVYVALSNGEWHGNHLYPESAENSAHALAIIADAAQETVTECLWQAWPLCAEHDLGMHPHDADGQLSWWCRGGRLRRGPASCRATAAGGAPCREEVQSFLPDYRFVFAGYGLCRESASSHQQRTEAYDRRTRGAHRHYVNCATARHHENMTAAASGMKFPRHRAT